MKIINLNAWGGHEFKPLVEFIKKEASSTDIFCFQEIINTSSSVKEYKNYRVNLLAELENVLPNYSFAYTPMIENGFYEGGLVDWDIQVGLATFFKNDQSLVLKKADQELIFSYPFPFDSDNENGSSKLQISEFEFSGIEFRIINFHGISFPFNKLDTDKRVAQSQAILDVLNDKRGPVIVMGDFNLLPETRSIKMLEEEMVNLIKKYSIQNTRSVLTGYRGKVEEQRFADYMFLTEDIKPLSFTVPDINISDHLPLVLEFNL